MTHNPTVEVFTPPPPGQHFGTLEVVGPDHPTFNYPRQWVMPDGKMLQVIGRRAFRLTPATWTWASLKLLAGGNGPGFAGLMLPGGTNGSNRVMVIGGLREQTAVATT